MGYAVRPKPTAAMLENEGVEHGAGVEENRTNDPAPLGFAIAHHDGAHHDRGQQHGQQTKVPTFQTHHHPQIDIAPRAALRAAGRASSAFSTSRETNGSGESRDTCRPRIPVPADPSAGTPSL